MNIWLQTFNNGETTETNITDLKTDPVNSNNNKRFSTFSNNAGQKLF